LHPVKSFPNRITHEIETRRLIERGESILIAVSGGVDSMVLLRLLASHLASRLSLRITIAHFNHQLRGAESDADESFVVEAAAQLGLPVVVGREDVSARAAREGISIEMAARAARHGFFARTARERSVSKIALAHHADDQAELFFLRLFRGSGTGAMGGMGWSDPSPGDPGIQLVRPLLGARRMEIEAQARIESIPFRADSSNASTAFERNRIRHDLMGVVEGKWGTDGIRRSMEILGAESELLDSVVKRWRESGERNFGQAPVALQRRIIQQELWRIGAEADFETIELLRNKADFPVCVKGGLCVARDEFGTLRFVRSRDLTFSGERAEVDLSLTDGTLALEGGEIRWRREPAAGEMGGAENREFFDAERVGDRVVVRRWRPGDRFRPIGMIGEVKVQDLFTNLKVPAEERRNRWVAEAANGELFWIEGIRIAEGFKLDKGSRTRLKWEWYRSP
jgi:tRNA(Ile)-lysidine synthase